MLKTPINRRRLNLFFGLGILSSFRSFALTPAKNAKNCTSIDIKDDNASIGIAKDRLYYWISGYNIHRSGRFCLYLDFPQKEFEFVEKIVLIDRNQKLWEFDIFKNNSQDSLGRLPIIIFENIRLKKDTHFLMVQTQEFGAMKIYRYTFTEEEIQRSQFSSVHIPIDILLDLKKHKHKISTLSHFLERILLNKACNPQSLQVHSCIKQHSFASWFESIKGDSFTLVIQCPHINTDKNHYLRYCFVLDPVGRFLAIKKFAYSPTNHTNIRMQAISKEEMITFKIKEEQRSSIQDLPYVMVFIEDSRDSLMHRDVWLR